MFCTDIITYILETPSIGETATVMDNGACYNGEETVEIMGAGLLVLQLRQLGIEVSNSCL